MRLSQPEALALTLAVEGVIAFAIAPRFGATRRGAALAAVVGSLITHPLLWSGVYRLRPLLGRATVPLLEGLVILAESIGYRLLATGRWRTALVLSAIANGASWLSGVVLYALA